MVLEVLILSDRPDGEPAEDSPPPQPTPPLIRLAHQIRQSAAVPDDDDDADPETWQDLERDRH